MFKHHQYPLSQVDRHMFLDHEDEVFLTDDRRSVDFRFPLDSKLALYDDHPTSSPAYVMLAVMALHAVKASPVVDHAKMKECAHISVMRLAQHLLDASRLGRGLHHQYLRTETLERSLPAPKGSSMAALHLSDKHANLTRDGCRTEDNTLCRYGHRLW